MFCHRFASMNTNSLSLIFVLCAIALHGLVEAKDFYFKYYSFRKKQKHAKMYKGIERECETRSCLDLIGLEQIKCTRKCVSEACYSELYAWDELEEGEIDVRFNSFKGCVANELQNNEMNSRKY
ncbi:uncharacterized protein LOC110252918 [Exaiptasia diaphana]|uniref:Uncharacterized protein n=1 Tax=Exaiptasia diaphana TaxID=2652724 RepID=A0A913Y787_EXADI|nr:uncharacterized protein LOC110252918 [Exaiptasia diaphana]